MNKGISLDQPKVESQKPNRETQPEKIRDNSLLAPIGLGLNHENYGLPRHRTAAKLLQSYVLQMQRQYGNSYTQGQIIEGNTHAQGSKPVTKTAAPTIQRVGPAVAGIAARASAFLATVGSRLTGQAMTQAANAAENLGKIGSTAGSAVGAVGKAGGMLGTGGHATGGLQLPRDVMSSGDFDKLKVMAQYKIINWVCSTWVNDPANKDIVDYLRNPSSATGATAATPPASSAAPPSSASPPTAPTVSPESDDIKAAVLEAAKDNIQLELSETFRANRKSSGPEYWWGEDDTHSGPESVGSSGVVYFTDVVTTAIDEDINLNEDAKLLKIPLSDKGAMRIRKIVSGTCHTRVEASRWDSLEITFAGGGVQINELGAEGSISLNFQVDWKWDANTTASDHLLIVNPDGTGEWQPNWSGEPDDNSFLPSFEESGMHKSWGQQEEFGSGLNAEKKRRVYERERERRARPGTPSTPGRDL